MRTIQSPPYKEDVLDGASRHNVKQVLVLFKRSHTEQPCLIRGEVRTWYPSKDQVVNRVVMGEGEALTAGFWTYVLYVETTGTVFHPAWLFYFCFMVYSRIQLHSCLDPNPTVKSQNWVRTFLKTGAVNFFNS